MIRAVVDSTILVSAFLVKSGPANELLHQADAGFFMCLCPEILEETSRVLLNYQRIRRRYQYPDDAAREYVQLLALVAQISTDLPIVHGAVRDPNDDVVIACRAESEVDSIVTRDKDLLSLGNIERLGCLARKTFWSSYVRSRRLNPAN